MNDKEFSKKMEELDLTLSDMEGEKERKERKQREMEIEISAVKFNNRHINVQDIRWLIKALFTEKHRPLLKYIHVRMNGYAEATDGKRLHIIKSGIPLSPGLWKVFSKKRGEVLLEKEKSDVRKYPDTDRVIPDVSLPTYSKVDLTGCKHASAVMCKIVKALPTKSGVDYDYIKDIGLETNYAHVPNESKAMVFDSEARRAVLMPLMLD